MLYKDSIHFKNLAVNMYNQNITLEHNQKIGLNSEEGHEYWRKKNWMILFLGLKTILLQTPAK